MQGQTNFGHVLVNRVRARRFSNQFDGAGNTLATIIDQLREMVDIEAPTREEVLEGAAFVYDTIIAPIDIPVVPNLIEPHVDRALRGVFLEAVGRAYDKIVNR